MLNQHSLEEIGEINNLLENIKQEYHENIKIILANSDIPFFHNPHCIPKLEKIHINRGLGLSAQNTNILKKSINELMVITGQKPIITKSKKAIAGFKIRNNIEIGLTVTLRGKKMYAFLNKLVFFTFAQIRDFRGLSLRSFDKAGNYTFGLKEQLIFPEIDYEDVDQLRGLTITLVISNVLSKRYSTSTNKILNGMILFRFLRFPINEYGVYEKYTLIPEIKQIWDRKRHLKRKKWSQE